MLFQAQNRNFFFFHLGQDSAEPSGSFYISRNDWLCFCCLFCFVFFFQFTFKQTKAAWHRSSLKYKKRNVLTFQKLSKEGSKTSCNSSAISLSCQQGVPLSCSLPVAGCVLCVCVCMWVSACVCLSHSLSVIYCSSSTLPPFCLLVNCHGEEGYTRRLRSAINLDTSYLCLPLQGEACPVTNMINPLPLCWQPPCTHPLTSILPSV